jgi:hypothetical protein
VAEIRAAQRVASTLLDAYVGDCDSGSYAELTHASP